MDRQDSGFMLSGLHPSSPLGPLSDYLPAPVSRQMFLPGFCAGPIGQAVTLGLLDDPSGLFTTHRWLDVTDGQIHGSGPWLNRFSAAACTPAPERHIPGLLPHQQDAVDKACTLEGFACFDAVGTGKTITALAWASQLGLDTVVLCPASLVDQWQQKWSGYSGMPVVAVTGTAAARRKLYGSAPPRMVVSYEAATSDLDVLLRLCAGRAVVFDEAHRLRNPSTKRTRMGLQIARVAARRLVLSATPVDNDVSELYWLMSGLVQPWLWGSPQRFTDQFGDSPDVDVLAQMAAPFYTRHVLVDAHQHLHRVVAGDDRLSEQYRELMRSAKDVVAATLPGAAEERVSAATTGLLRMAAVSPRLLHRSSSRSARRLSRLIDDVPGPKVEHAVQAAAGWAREGHKTVLFCSYTALFDTLCAELAAAGLSYVIYEGSMDAGSRAAAVEEFTTAGGAQVLLASDAAAEGLNLGRWCNHSISLDVPYTPGRKGQRAGRIWRMDTASEEAVHLHLVTAGTIEHGLSVRLARKASLMERLLPPTGPPVEAMTSVSRDLAG